MSTTSLLTLEQFEQIPEEGGVRYELKGGDLIKIGTAKSRHERTKFKIARCLILYIEQHPIGEVYSESSFVLSPSCVRMPDVSFLRAELVAESDPDRLFACAPDIAIEVVSESESAPDLREKIQDYLDAGTKAVWAFYPTLRVIAIYDHAGVRELRCGQVLEFPDVLPGFQASIDQFFE